MSVKIERRVVRETAAVDRGKPIMIELCEGGGRVELWRKGERTRYVVPIFSIYQLGAQIVVNARQQERELRRRLRHG